MENKKELLLSAVQLATVTVGTVLSAVIDYPEGALMLIPLSVAPLSELYKLKKKQAT